MVIGTQNRITIDPSILLGKPVITGTRIPVYVILNLLAQGKTNEYIIQQYPDLNAKDIQAAVKFAAETVNFTEEATGSNV